MAKTIKLAKLEKDMERWPKAWAGFDSDTPIGKEFVKIMRPFVLAMVEDHLAYTTVNRHMGNLWLLGGEIIARVQTDPEPKDLAAEDLILRFVDDEGGPYSKHLATEEEQRAFDATCKKLYRFMIQKPRRQ